MKKCCIYLDALEKGISEDASAWQDVLIHSSKCPDCATDMKRRGEIFEIMAEMSEPEYPSLLHSAIMSGIADAEARAEDDDEPGWFSRIFDRLLQPVEFAVSLACLVMFAFLMQVDHSLPFADESNRAPGIAGRQLAVVDDKSQTVASHSLANVSAAEIDQFLRELAEFNRTHGGGKLQPPTGFTPELRLVNDLSNRR